MHRSYLNPHSTLIAPLLSHPRREVWSKHDPDGTGRVPAPRLPFIVDDLPPPLGMGGQQASLSALTQFLLRCDIPDRDGLVTFHEVLYALAHKAALDAMPQASSDVGGGGVR